jgi:hypothetical protein
VSLDIPAPMAPRAGDPIRARDIGDMAMAIHQLTQRVAELAQLTAMLQSRVTTIMSGISLGKITAVDAPGVNSTTGIINAASDPPLASEVTYTVLDMWNRQSVPEVIPASGRLAPNAATGVNIPDLAELRIVPARVGQEVIIVRMVNESGVVSARIMVFEQLAPVTC